MSVCLSVCKKDNSAKVVEVFGSHFMTERSGVARILCQGGTGLASRKDRKYVVPPQAALYTPEYALLH